MTPDWVVRQAWPEDAEGFVRAHESSWDAVGLVEQRLGELASFDERLKMFEAGVEKVSDDAQIWVAEREGKIVGLAVCSRAAGIAELRDLYVVPEAWGSGVARALHGAALDWMRPRADEAMLWVGEGNARARRFYEREGWRADGETRESPLGPRELRYRLTF
jgi:GNAT superfamily N-acetyltransferase